MSLTEEDFTSRARLTRAGSVIVLKNINGCYAALKVRSGEAKDRRRGSCLSMSLTRIAARIFQRRTKFGPRRLSYDLSCSRESSVHRRLGKAGLPHDFGDRYAGLSEFPNLSNLVRQEEGLGAR